MRFPLIRDTAWVAGIRLNLAVAYNELTVGKPTTNGSAARFDLMGLRRPPIQGGVSACKVFGKIEGFVGKATISAVSLIQLSNGYAVQVNLRVWRPEWVHAGAARGHGCFGPLLELKKNVGDGPGWNQQMWAK